MQTLRLRNPKALEIDSINALFARALASTAFPIMAVSSPEIARLISDPHAHVQIGIENDKDPRGVSITVLPENPLDQRPQVPLFYVDKGAKIRKPLIQGIVDFVRENGYTTFWAINFTGHSDKAWSKVMAPVGWGIKPVGSIMEFGLNE